MCTNMKKYQTQKIPTPLIFLKYHSWQTQCAVDIQIQTIFIEHKKINEFNKWMNTYAWVLLWNSMWPQTGASWRTPVDPKAGHNRNPRITFLARNVSKVLHLIVKRRSHSNIFFDSHVVAECTKRRWDPFIFNHSLAFIHITPVSTSMYYGRAIAS